MLSSNTSAVSGDTTYVEDVFSTWLYNGTGASGNVISNGLDLSTKGGLVWLKQRSGSATSHTLMDTARGTSVFLSTNNTNADSAYSVLSSFNSNGFTIGQGAVNNASGQTYASWTFRKQPKFFDVVTYTGQTDTPQTIAHNLGSAPGMIIIKAVNDTGNWVVYHRSNGAGKYMYLNTTGAAVSSVYPWNNTSPTDTSFSIGAFNPVNYTGNTYVAYLFAHDAGGFGLTGTDNVISCGSYTGNGSSTGPIVNLGYEPQFIILKAAAGGTSGSQDWNMVDNMRGWTTSSNQQLNPNLSAAETSQNNIALNATGFQLTTAGADFNGSGNTYIYIAIRRGPMKVPTDATKVFYPQARTANGALTYISGIGFPPDMVWSQRRDTGGNSPSAIDKLRGPKQVLLQNSTSSELTSGASYDVDNFNQDGVVVQSAGQMSVINYLSSQVANWYFRRAPSFFDEVCYRGTGSARTVSHNLGVTPTLMIIKGRTNAFQWIVYAPSTAFTYPVIYLNSDGAEFDGSGTGYWNDTLPNSSTFTVGTQARVNGSGVTYVAYLFATCAGVSKVGSYTGTGTTNQIDCGFAAGARFVLIKRTDSTGDWYVWDSARGIVSGNDPYLLLNSTAAEVTSTDYIDPYSAGFEISSTAPAAINASGGTYIFLAIA